MDESIRAELVALVGEDEAARFAERARVAFHRYNATVTGVALVFETRLDRDVLVITASDPDGNMYQLADSTVGGHALNKVET